MGEVRHLGEFGGLVPPPYRFVCCFLALLVFVCLAPLHSPYWGAATHLKYKKNLPDAGHFIVERKESIPSFVAFFEVSLGCFCVNKC